jgi:predicted metal-dependent peptidase
MICNSRLRPAIVATLGLLVSSCSGHIDAPAFINRDAAARCAQNIDAWKQEVAKLDALQKEFDSTSEQIRVRYRYATPEEKLKLRANLADVVTRTDESGEAADALFSEIMRELEYVPRNKSVRAKLALITTALKEVDGVRTPEVQLAMDAVSSQLHVLLRID